MVDPVMFEKKNKNKKERKGKKGKGERCKKVGQLEKKWDSKNINFLTRAYKNTFPIWS